MLSKNANLILDYLKSNPGSNVTSISNSLKIHHSVITREIRELEIDKVLFSKKSNNTVGWFVNSQSEEIVQKKLRKFQEKDLKSQISELSDRLIEERLKNKFHDELSSQPIERTIFINQRERHEREGALVVMGSDWHIEETVDSESVGGCNSYSLDIAKSRIKRMYEGAHWLLAHHRSSYKIRDVVLWFGGDHITGHIHDELVETTSLAPLQAASVFKNMMVEAIDSFLADDQIENILVPCNYGNHGRTTKERRVATGWSHSYEWAVYKDVQHYYKNEPRVKIEAPKSAHTIISVYGWNLHFHHGDETKYSGGIGGLSIPLMKYVSSWDTIPGLKAHYHHIGHWHTFLDLGRVICNGSVIGHSAYGTSVRASYQEPVQASYLLDSKRGKCLVSPIWVDENHPIHK